MEGPRALSSGADFVALPPGQAIGRYEVLAVLGHGGFGITYRARDRDLGREVAIKEYLPPALAVRQDGTTVLPRSPREADDFNWGRERFVDEGRTLGGLQKAPAIVRVYDFLEANGTAYIVMELVRGDTLEERLKRAGPLGAADVERLLWPLLDGLARVHAAGFLHRDIKPANILLDHEGDPTLIDFGASRAAIADRTSAMTAVFTPGYAASEQVTSARQGPWTDIYALAATLYHAITGRKPPNVFDRMIDDAYEPLSRLKPRGFAPGLLVGIDAGLAVRADDRPQSIAGWRTLLTQAAAAGAQATVVSTASPARAAAFPTAGPSRRNGLRTAIAAAAITVVVAGGYLAWSLREADRAHRPAPEAQAGGNAVAATARADETRVNAETVAAEKRRQDDEARLKAEARRKADEDSRKAAEIAEAALRLGVAERQRVQIALTAAGFDTRGSDGTLGPRSREMIANWQKARDQPATGFLTAAQTQALLREGGAAIARHEEEKKKADDDRKKLEDEATARAATAAPAAMGAFDGSYAGAFAPSGTFGPTGGGSHAISLRVAAGAGTGTMVSARCGSAPISIRISAAGDVTGETTGLDASCSRLPLVVQGRAANGKLQLAFSGAAGGGTAALVLGAAASPPSEPPPGASSAASSAGGFDGRYGGSVNSFSASGPGRVLGVDLQVVGGRLVGRVVSPVCGDAAIALALSPAGEISGEARLQEGPACSTATLGVSGQISGARLALEMRGAGLRIHGSLSKRGG